MKVNLGSGQDYKTGYVNVDLRPPADLIADMLDLRFEHLEEVVIEHALEHLSRADRTRMLLLIKSWLGKDGVLVVEVPDLSEIMGRWADYPMWEQYLYGSQDHDGEYHKSGYTAASLHDLLTSIGFGITSISQFASPDPNRISMPCVRIEAVK